MNSNRNLDKLLRVIFPEVLMEYFEISGWHDDSAKIEVWLDEKNGSVRKSCGYVKFTQLVCII